MQDRRVKMCSFDNVSDLIRSSGIYVLSNTQSYIKLMEYINCKSIYAYKPQ